MLTLEVRAYSGGSFANDLQDSECCTLVQVTSLEPVECEGKREARCPARCDQHIEQIRVILPHR